MTNHLLEISTFGQSIWMDNLSRDLIESGELKQMTQDQGIRGITSNPAILKRRFQAMPPMMPTSKPGSKRASRFWISMSL